MKIVHLTHHKGTAADLEYTAHTLGHEIETIFYNGGYNISANKANTSWHELKDKLNSVDIVITSDTAPLSRIILQNMNEFQGHLIIWCCNRFDYTDQATNTEYPKFPDSEYYSIFRAATNNPQVTVIPYTSFEAVYCRWYDILIKEPIITPHGKQLPTSFVPIVPETINKPETAFIPPYHNDSILMDLEAKVRSLGIPAYRGRYNGPQDLAGFKCVIHIPYSWSTLAFFEGIQMGLRYIIPSEQFLLKLYHKEERFFWSPPFWKEYLEESEWYNTQNKELLTYFDDWTQLKEIVDNIDNIISIDKVKYIAENYANKQLESWKNVFGKIRPIS